MFPKKLHIPYNKFRVPQNKFRVPQNKSGVHREDHWYKVNVLYSYVFSFKSYFLFRK